MSKCLERILGGLLNSILTFSFILLPLDVNNVYADSDRPKLYKKGENFDDVVQKTKMEKYTQAGDNDKFKHVVYQGILGMMSVVLVEAIRWKYLYKLKPEVYGKDCKQNTAAKYTIPIAQLSALTYLIGDISTNFKFRKIAKNLSDSYEDGVMKKFDPKEKTDFDAMTEEEKKEYKKTTGHTANEASEVGLQVRAFNELISSLEGQKSALKTKIALDTITSVGFTLASSVELAKIVQCGIVCKKSLLSKKRNIASAKKNLSLAKGMASALLTALSSECSGSLGTSALACAAIPTCTLVMKDLVGTAVKKTNQLISDTKDTTQATVRTKLEGNSESGKWSVKLFKNMGKYFNFDIMKEKGNKGIAQIINEAPEDDVDKKNKNDKIKSKKKKSKLGVNSKLEIASSGKFVTKVKLCSSKVMGSATASSLKHIDLERYIRKALENYHGYSYGDGVKCCGSKGMSKSFSLLRRNTDKSLQAIVGTLMGGDIHNKLIKMDTSDKAAEEALAKANKATEKGLESFPKAEIEKLGLDNKTQDFLKKISEQVEKEEAISSSKDNTGNLIGYSTPAYSHLFERDIYIHPFKRHTQKVRDSIGPGMKNVYFDGQKLDIDLKSAVLAGIENRIRQVAIRESLSFKFENKFEEISHITYQNKKIDLAMKSLKSFLDENDLNLLTSPSSFDNKHLNKMASILSNLFFSDAHAFIGKLGGGGKSTIAGAACNAGVEMMGNITPFVSLLNVGCQFLTMRGLLGRYARNFGMVRPVGRTATFGAMTATSFIIKKWDKDTHEKIEKRLEVLKAERLKYIKSSSRKNNFDDSKFNGGGFQKSNYARNTGANGDAFIKQCATPSAGGFRPVTCSSSPTKSKSMLPKPDRVTAQIMGAPSMSALPIMANLSSKVADGTFGEADLSASKLGAIGPKTQAAMKRRNEKLAKIADAMQAQNKLSKGKPVFLSDIIAATKKALTGGAPIPTTGSAGLFSAGVTANNDDEDKKDEDEKVEKLNASVATPNFGAGISGGDGELDFSDEEGLDQMGIADGENAIENLDEFEIDHNDINDKKEVSIFKILSNRYIISYPKVLEEKEEQK